MFADALELGLTRELLIREERCTSTDRSCRLLYLSDLHLGLGRDDRLLRQMLDAAEHTRPDAVLLGGDLVDRPDGNAALSRLVRELKALAPVLAVGGNHDDAVGLPAVAAAVTAGGGRWIHAAAASLRSHGRRIVIAGPEARQPPSGDVRILCAHHPCAVWSHRAGHYHVVLAGHLHGCQFVALQLRNYLFPGAIFYPYCCLRTTCAGATLIVSRGVSDLVPIRWRCPREAILCHV